jgi:hypothetical protein
MRLNPSIAVELSQKYREIIKTSLRTFCHDNLATVQSFTQLGGWSLDRSQLCLCVCVCVGVLRVVCYWCKGTLLLGAGVFGRFRL